MITAKIKVEIDLDMKLKNYTHPNISEIKPRLEAELIKTFRDALGEDEMSDECETQSKISITQLEVEEEKEERGN
jgi:hypothetical protein